MPWPGHDEACGCEDCECRRCGHCYWPNENHFQHDCRNPKTEDPESLAGIPDYPPACCVCGTHRVGYWNYRDQSFCWPCADGEPPEKESRHGYIPEGPGG